MLNFRDFLILALLPTLCVYVKADSLEQSYSRNVPLNMTTEHAARAINSISFLKELVKFKDTCNEKYYHLNDVSVDTRKIESGLGLIHVVEYTGRLWFLRKTPIRFQEAIALKEISSCGKYSSLQCITKYKTGSKGNWVDCSRVTCSFSPKDHNARYKEDSLNSCNSSRSFDLNISSEVLVNVPLFGIGKKVTSFISDTFENAVTAFLDKECHGAPPGKP